MKPTDDLRYAFIAACMAHVEGYYSTGSLAFRENNPGNIGVHNHQSYLTKLDGFTALVADIAANTGKPLREFIFKYAPPTENNSNSYLEEVSTLSGVSPDEIL